MKRSNKVFVLLRSENGSRFFTFNKEGVDPTVLYDGTPAYEVIGYAETVEEAQVKLYGKAYPLKK